jgi:DNA-binding MarR family transcriptional regulator
MTAPVSLIFDLDQELRKMATSPSVSRAAADPLLHVLMGTLVASVRSDGPDLTARQLAVFLKIYLEPSIDHTVRGLAAILDISKPAITRSLDRLEELDFTKRETDRNDRRSVIARRTPSGSTYLRTLSGYLADASKTAKK